MLLEKAESPGRAPPLIPVQLSASPGSCFPFPGALTDPGQVLEARGVQLFPWAGRAQPGVGLLLSKPAWMFCSSPKHRCCNKSTLEQAEPGSSAKASNVWNFRGAHSETVLRNYVKVYSRAFFNLCRLREHKASL